jgi:hypothetical protein
VRRPLVASDVVARSVGLHITSYEVHAAVKWQALPWIVTGADGRWVLPHDDERMPLSFTLEARRP